MWTAPAGAKLTTATPVTLTYDNGAGLVFTRTIALDDKLHVHGHRRGRQQAAARRSTLTPYGRVTRLGEPQTAGYYILHEGLIGVFGDSRAEESTYKRPQGQAAAGRQPKATSGWLGITDKYWAAALVRRQAKPFTGALRHHRTAERPLPGRLPAATPVTVAGRRHAPTTTNRLFAGAKQVAVVDGYRDAARHRRASTCLIDWGWFWFITKPMFFLIDWFFRLFGNFGLAILAVTVLVKARLLPARQQVLQVDERDEEGAAADDRRSASASRTTRSSSSRR